MVKIFLFGYTGMLGNYLYYYLRDKYTVIPFSRKEMDIATISFTNLEATLNTYDIAAEDTIINAIGLIPQAGKNGAAMTGRNYIKINSIFPQWLSIIATKYACHIIHPTTDCVFSGIGPNAGNYREDSSPNGEDIYAITKSLGEVELNTNIRTSIIGEEVYNKRSLVEWIKSKKNGELDGYINHYWNGITCLQFAKLVDEIISKELFWKGTLHIFSPRSVSKYELCQMINNTYQLDIDVKSHLCESAVDKTLTSMYPSIFTIPPLEEQIQEMKIFGDTSGIFN